MNFAQYVLKDLQDGGQLDENTYALLSEGLQFFGPALFDGLKALYNKAHEVAQDIEEHGAKGCCGRNFGRSVVPAKAGRGRGQ